jgi:hypothetical protein
VKDEQQTKKCAAIAMKVIHISICQFYFDSTARNSFTNEEIVTKQYPPV